MQKLIKMIILAITLSHTPLIYAQSDLDAQRLCTDATKRMLVEHGAPATIDATNLCAKTAYSADKWQCVITHMDKGAGYGNATSSCGMSTQVSP
jgi:hypothetical protein